MSRNKFVSRRLFVGSLYLLFSVGIASSQSGPNLIINPSFEANQQLPVQRGNFDNYVSSWFATNTCCLPPVTTSPNCPPQLCVTPDYFHRQTPGACVPIGIGVPYNSMGEEEPKHGDAYAGIVTYNPERVPIPPCQSDFSNSTRYVEYISVPLASPMVVGRTYNVGMSVSLAEVSQYAVGDLGMVFSTQNPVFENCDPESASPLIAVGGNELSNPVVSLSPIKKSEGWYQISGEVVADKPYQYVTVGRFQTIPTVETLVETTFKRCQDQDPKGRGLMSFYYVDDLYANEKMCNCDGIAIDRLINDANRCCAYFQLRLKPGFATPGAGCSPSSSQNAISRIKITPCDPNVTLTLSVHYTNHRDHYRLVDGDTFEYIGETGDTVKPIPFKQTVTPHDMDSIPGFICWEPCLDPNRHVCLKFQFQDSSGNVICEQRVNF